MLTLDLPRCDKNVYKNIKESNNEENKYEECLSCQ